MTTNLARAIKVIDRTAEKVGTRAPLLAQALKRAHLLVPDAPNPVEYGMTIDGGRRQDARAIAAIDAAIAANGSQTVTGLNWNSVVTGGTRADCVSVSLLHDSVALVAIDDYTRARVLLSADEATELGGWLLAAATSLTAKES